MYSPDGVHLVLAILLTILLTRRRETLNKPSIVANVWFTEKVANCEQLLGQNFFTSIHMFQVREITYGVAFYLLHYVDGSTRL